MNKLFAYPGGKSPIRNLIVAHFPAHENYKTYVDVFGGSAAILLTKERSDGEVYNDKNDELANFFRVVKHRPAELAERARFWLHSRTMWNEFRYAESKPFDEVERAFMFWARLQDSFGGRGMNFGMSKDGVKSVTNARQYLDEVSARLQKVHVENLSFEKCIANYDSPETFFYLDPPYPNTKGGSSNYDNLSVEEWKNFRALLGKIKGKFLLSCNDDPEVIKMFRGFNIKFIDVRVTLAKNNNSAKRREILMSNYPLPKAKHNHAPVYAAGRNAKRRVTKKVMQNAEKEFVQ